VRIFFSLLKPSSLVLNFFSPPPRDFSGKRLAPPARIRLYGPGRFVRFLCSSSFDSPPTPAVRRLLPVRGRDPGPAFSSFVTKIFLKLFQSAPGHPLCDVFYHVDFLRSDGFFFFRVILSRIYFSVFFFFFFPKLFPPFLTLIARLPFFFFLCTFFFLLP